MEYGQFCPVAKATEILGDRWSLLIIRELLMGASRFNVLQRGLSAISPTVLTKRLNELANEGILIKKKIQGQKGYEYFLTECGREIYPVIEQLGKWGMRWARGGMPDVDLDPELFMLYMERCVLPEKLIGNETVIRFHFTDIEKMSHWWLVVKNNHIDACIQDPGKDVDVYITSTLRTMIEAWMGDTTYKKEIANGNIVLVGTPELTKNPSSWIQDALFHGIAPATEILQPV